MARPTDRASHIRSDTGAFVAVKAAFALNLFGGVSRRVFVEAAPSAIAVSLPSCRCIDRLVPLKHGLCLADEIVRYLRTDERTAAANTFRIDVRVLIRVAGVLKRAYDAPCRGTACGPNTGTCGSRSQPARCDDWPEAGNGKQTQTCEQSTRAAQ